MMLHRHFENQKEQRENLTTLNDVTPKPVYDPFAVAENDEPFETTDYQPRRGRRRKED